MNGDDPDALWVENFRLIRVGGKSTSNLGLRGLDIRKGCGSHSKPRYELKHAIGVYEKRIPGNTSPVAGCFLVFGPAANVSKTSLLSNQFKLKKLDIGHLNEISRGRWDIGCRHAWDGETRRLEEMINPDRNQLSKLAIADTKKLL